MKRLEDYFLRTGFYDLLPQAKQLAEDLGYDQAEMIEAVCKTSDKFYNQSTLRHFTPSIYGH